MYRTYRNLYRIRPSISSIGEGKNRIRLPKGMSVTVDTVGLALILWLPCSFTLGKLFAAFIGQFFSLSPLWPGIAISLFISFRLSKLDPAGKTTLRFLWDLLRYWCRSHNSNGFAKYNRLRSGRSRLRAEGTVCLTEGERIGSLPATGIVSIIDIKVPVGVRVSKRGNIRLHHKRGHRVEPGFYELKDGKLEMRKAPPKLKRPLVRKAD